MWSFNPLSGNLEQQSGAGGGSGEQLLSSTVFNVNTIALQDLYTVPAGKRLFVTRVLLRDKSANGGANDLVGVSRSAPTVVGIVMLTDIGAMTTSQYKLGIPTTSVPVGAGNSVQAGVDTEFGAPATIVIDLFGYLLDA